MRYRIACIAVLSALQQANCRLGYRRDTFGSINSKYIGKESNYRVWNPLIKLWSNTRRIFLVLMLGFLSGCSPAARSNIGAIATGAAGASASDTVKLMLFGGMDHKEYLGCLNCSQYAVDSVFNEYGHNGSRYSSESIWNHYSEYGSAYSMYGACNAYASDPPVIVDSTGKYYGRLTLNQYHAELGVGARYYNWLMQTVCETN